MQSLPIAQRAHDRHVSQIRAVTPLPEPELEEGERFVPAAAFLAVLVTLGLIFFGRW